MPLPKVLFVEDRPDIQDLVACQLNGFAEIIGATTILEAKDLFAQHANQLAAIVFDFDVPNGDPNDPLAVNCTINMIRECKKTFSGPMIAASSNSSCRQMQLQYGCTHETEKRHISRSVLKALGLR